jgi:hypothetical protein
MTVSSLPLRHLLILLACAAMGWGLSGCSRPSPPAAPPPPLTAAQQAAAIARGKVIAAETFSVLSSNLQSAIASGGVSNALPFCSLAASPLTTAVAEQHGAKVRRVTHKPRNPAARASAAETAVLDQFRAALQPGQPPPPLATNWVAGQATFLAPIVLSHALCLQCHGEPERDLTSENLALIRRLYPQDEAVGFKSGELRGAWRIDLPLATLQTPSASPTAK